MALALCRIRSSAPCAGRRRYDAPSPSCGSFGSGRSFAKAVAAPLDHPPGLRIPWTTAVARSEKAVGLLAPVALMLVRPQISGVVPTHPSRHHVVLRRFTGGETATNPSEPGVVTWPDLSTLVPNSVSLA